MKFNLVDVSIDVSLFDFAMDIIFEEWGDGDPKHLSQKKEKAKKDQVSKCFVLLCEDNPVGCFVICQNDIKGFPTYNPNLACVCIAKEFRGKGYSSVMLNLANKKFKDLGIQEAYLKTQLNDFYEKFGWEYVKDIVVEGNKEKLYHHTF